MNKYTPRSVPDITLSKIQNTERALIVWPVSVILPNTGLSTALAMLTKIASGEG